MVPHLITALTGPINELEQRILDSMPAIERWFRLEWMEHTPPFYCSVDIRNAGFKLAPVDTNLYPGGWNNLTPEMLPLAVQSAMAAIEKICPEARNLLLIPENHTRNTFYLANVAQLKRIFHMAGLNVRIGSINPDIKKPTTVELPNGETVLLEPVIRSKHRLGLKDFDPCTILLNNDLSAGIPGILEDIHEQYLLPPLHAGWSVRRKSNHFHSYEEVSKRFGKLLGIDPWLINPMFDKCGEINFAEGAGMECLQTNVDALLTKMRRKYKEYGINEKPFVVVKADNGTYGMGIMTVRDVKDLEALNRKTRNKMSGHQGRPGSQRSHHPGRRADQRAHERRGGRARGLHDGPLCGGRLLPGARRARRGRKPQRTGLQLCAPGFCRKHALTPAGLKPGASAPNRFYMYGVIGRLAMVAASYELEATDPDAEVYD